MKIISEEQEDADDFGNTNHPHLNGAGAAAPGNCKASNGEGRKPAAENTCKAANGTVAKVESVSAVNGDSSLPVIVRKKKKKATRTNTLDGGCSSEKERFARIGYL